MREDAELLRTYAESGSEDAFSELVRRHVDFVHSVAMRRGGGDYHLAKDATQKVFIALAQNAARLGKHPVLAGWLFQTAKHAVLDIRRSEERLRRREQDLATMYEPTQAPDSTDLRGRLMSELDNLDAKDREAVLLRFFQGWQFSKIGEALRLTEDAARMRVERALGRIRVSLERNGVASSGAVIAAALADNTGLAAPEGLVTEITRTALTAGSEAHLATNTMTLASSAHIISAVSTLAVLIGIGGVALYYRSESEQMQRNLNQASRERIAIDIQARTEALRENVALAPTAAASVGPVGALVPGARIAPGQSNPADAGKDDVTLLKERLAAMPEKAIPELELLAYSDWAGVVSRFSPRDETRILPAFLNLRNLAKVRFAVLAIAALKEFAAEHNGSMPTQFDQVSRYIIPSVSPQIFTRYSILRTGSLDSFSESVPLVGETQGVSDSVGDTVVVFGKTVASIKMIAGANADSTIDRAIVRYASAHSGAAPKSADDLKGYLPAVDLSKAGSRIQSTSRRVTLGSP